MVPLRRSTPTIVSSTKSSPIVVSNAQESFSTTNWLITIAVTLLGGVLAYFVSGRALRPLPGFCVAG